MFKNEIAAAISFFIELKVCSIVQEGKNVFDTELIFGQKINDKRDNGRNLPKVELEKIRINYEVRGEGQPIVFLHGLGASWKMWLPQIDSFSSIYKMIMLDMRGHGESTKTFPDNKFSARVMEEDLKLFLDELNITKTHLVGLSYGSVTAQLFASKFPDFIDKLVLSNGYSEIP